MIFPDCECCGEGKGTVRVPHIGHVCPGCVVLLDRVHNDLSNPALGLSGCEPARPDQQLYDY
jgi:hypothetical protein